MKNYKILVQINEILVQINIFFAFHVYFLQTLLRSIQILTINHSLISPCLDAMRTTCHNMSIKSLHDEFTRLQFFKTNDLTKFPVSIHPINYYNI